MNVWEKMRIANVGMHIIPVAVVVAIGYSVALNVNRTITPELTHVLVMAFSWVMGLSFILLLMYRHWGWIFRSIWILCSGDINVKRVEK